MADNTPNLNLYLPGGGSTGLTTPDEVADIDRLNQNFREIDTFAGTTNTKLSNLEAGKGVGLIPAVADKAARDALFTSPANGNRVWRLDTKSEEYYDGTAWWRADNRIVPAAGVGTGVTIDADGTIRLAAVPSSTYVGVNGVFTSKYKAYRIRYNIIGGGSLVSRLTVGGTEVSANTYNGSRLHVSGTTAVAATDTNVNGMTIASFASALYTGEIEVHNPGEAGVTTPVRGRGQALGVMYEFGATAAAAAHDGFRIFTGATGSGWMTVEGIA